MTDDHTAAMQRIQDLQREFRDKQLEALRDGDYAGGAYFLGQKEGLVKAEKVIKDAE